jgi:hypothetical protein
LFRLFYKNCVLFSVAGSQSSTSNQQNFNASANQNRGLNAGDIIDVTNIASNDHGSVEEDEDDYFDLFD